MALLDVSQGMARIGVLEMVTRNILRISFGKLWLAVLFAPIGLSLASQIGLDPRIFAVTVVFAANCAFATPFAYQTSLLVMGPGSYQYKDFLKVGSPVVIIIWIVFSLIAPWYYGI